MSAHQKYAHLLQPLQIGNVILKNRMISSPSRPHFIQGGETYPTDPWIAHYERKARNGAAIVTCSGSGGERLDPVHGLLFDITDGHSQHYLSQLTEACHLYGTKVHMALYPIHDEKWDVSTGVDSIFVMGDGSTIIQGEEIPEEEMLRIVEQMSEQARILKEDCGFDGCFLHMCYRATLLARSLNPLTNKRTDKYGGSLENRARWPLMVCDAIKRKCGRDFLIEVCISGEDPEPDGWKLADSVEFAKMGVGHFDMLQLRSPFIDPNHPTSLNPEKTPWLYLAENVKKALTEQGIDMPIVAISGFTHPDLGEKALAEGKCDLIASARAFISNPEYGQLIQEGRGEDIVPCLRCNKCHKSSMADPWASVCSVNPVWGFEHKINRMILPVKGKRRVAVVGGGPTGMRAALVAADRGHDVDLYESRDRLGGLLNLLDDVSFKWTLTDFKNWLIRQVGKRENITVHLNCDTTPELLEKENYDAVIAAVGSEPILPPIPGVDGPNVITCMEAFPRAGELPEEIVVVGGGEIGIELGIYLARCGKKVTILEMKDRIAPDATPVHYYSMLMETWEAEKNLTPIVNALVTRIAEDGVYYRDAEGAEHMVPSGKTVVCVGMKPRQELALRFADQGDYFRVAGDCNKPGSVQKSQRAAFGAAISIL